jgi:hypothetical protein
MPCHLEPRLEVDALLAGDLGDPLGRKIRVDKTRRGARYSAISPSRRVLIDSPSNIARAAFASGSIDR